MSRDTSLTRVLLIWLTPQVLSLLLSAAPSAPPPRPVESVAAQQMIVVQMTAAAVLAPILFRSVGGVVAVIVNAAPMLQLAGFLSALSLADLGALYLLTGSWVFAIGALSMRSDARGKLLISAIATCWAVGGLMLLYLWRDFAPQRAVPDAVLGPAYVALKTLDPGPTSSHWYWVVVGSFITLGGIATCVGRRGLTEASGASDSPA